MMINRRAFQLALVATLSSATITLLAEDFSDVNGAPKWKVYNYNRSGNALRSLIPFFAPSGGIGFDFLSTPDTALLATDHPSYRGSLLGNLSGKTITADIQLNVTSGTQFQYYGQGSPGDCGGQASVRFYFQGNTNGPFDPTKYWWSNPVSVSLQTMTGGSSVPISAVVNPALWSDYNGKFGTDPIVGNGFSAAAQDVRVIGLSFGGGCFFENGVGIVPGSGSGSFQLVSFSVQ